MIGYQVKQIIENRYLERITAPMVADELHISKDWLHKSFKRYTGYTFNRYITVLRMRYAAKMIMCDTKIEAVSLLSGYKSKKNFYRNFRKIYNTTPIKYKKSNVLPSNSSL